MTRSCAIPRLLAARERSSGLSWSSRLETASRRGEVVRLGPQHVKDGRIRIERTHGSEGRGHARCRLQLQAACDAMPKAHLTYIVSAHGKPRSKYGLGNDFAKWATGAGLARPLPSARAQEGRYAAGSRRLGGTAHELMAISGHTHPERGAALHRGRWTGKRLAD